MLKSLFFYPISKVAFIEILLDVIILILKLILKFIISKKKLENYIMIVIGYTYFLLQASKRFTSLIGDEDSVGEEYKGRDSFVLSKSPILSIHYE